ncbi:FAD-dependent oxidoreductase [Pseudarthrobacter sp. NPDC058196]|uniref:FAD-dependent oxidoreductase n=1 Tax=Pseudarthrobacter sp. NPDC058196 TaxID=3346376 RepID=UPI0036DF4104
MAELAADVVIAGGGPVGLFLAALLLQEGVAVKVLEQRQSRNQHTRAIGIHPPALRALARVGVASTMVQEGVRIRKGVALSGGKTVGTMDFGTVSADFPFVLALPQFRTEKILEDRVRALDPDALVRGANVTGLTDHGGRVTVAFDSTEHSSHGPARATAALLVAADGARSGLRATLGVTASRRTYPDHYLMGDFDDDSGLGEKAALFLEQQGIVESFPLPGGIRRWVVRLNCPAGAATAADLAGLVRRRTGIRPDPATTSMLSAFSVSSAIARRAVAGRTILLGDAAHEISPIGGQGMNLGWFDAEALAPLVSLAVAGGPAHSQFSDFERARRRAAVRARRQAEINMALGRPLAAPLLRIRTAALRTAASIPAVNRWAGRRFTMQ